MTCNEYKNTDQRKEMRDRREERERNLWAYNQLRMSSLCCGVQTHHSLNVAKRLLLGLGREVWIWRQFGPSASFLGILRRACVCITANCNIHNLPNSAPLLAMLQQHSWSQISMTGGLEATKPRDLDVEAGRGFDSPDCPHLAHLGCENGKLAFKISAAARSWTLKEDKVLCVPVVAVRWIANEMTPLLWV